MKFVSDPLDRALLDDWQRDFPLESRPFDRVAEATGLDEAEVISRLTEMVRSGRVTRVGATCAPNSVSASTLAAVAAPEAEVERIATIIGTRVGVNHSYHRENLWNLWFVATGPDRAHVDATLADIERETGLQVLDLRLVRPFNVDLGFRMSDAGEQAPPAPRPVDLSVMQPGDRRLLQQLTAGLPLSQCPYAELAARMNRTEKDVVGRIAVLQAAGIIARFGVIVRHRALGWSSNAMVVWNLARDRVEAAGTALAAIPGVTLCYERRPVADTWPYRLYNMIHARSRAEAHEVLNRARALPELAGADNDVLFSTRCFKQTGALISLRSEGAA